ncbi:MAG: hypothetical protein IPK97_03815 [Ahniella sp.]|nr:hypothetical protein [Ahniella sp.]
MAMILLGIGGLIAFVGAIWLIVVAFKKSILWGFVALLVPLGNVVFAIMNWPSQKPFLILIGGAVLTIIGSVMGASTIAMMPPS